ncbi:fungal-specific transcription factor domain-containing protein [Dactylonectria macrodidyma]|uniref:Fungal-specific transcription factor domain-containing protein n=1 Tax=Dactylonectria macrodidyma TaxID=307937 RepID=A0A9P9FS99_9HYPO|nr:fungal-specific transcription factor domain-containing protein [Dactylonectria macrodidyma]
MPSSAPGAPSRRKHVTTACVSCRESKVKCDGLSPICSNCKNKGKECRYQAGDDKRKLSLRVAIELLSGRIEQLCNFIQDNSLQPPLMPEDEQVALVKVLGHLKLTHTYASRDASNKAASNTRTSPKQSSHNVQTGEPSPTNQENNTRTAVQPPAPESLTPWARLSDGILPSIQVAKTASNHTHASDDMNLLGEPTPHDQLSASLPTADWNNGDAGFSFQSDFPLEAGFFGDMISFSAVGSEGVKERIRLPTEPVNPDDAASDTESTEALVEQLSDRIGSLQIGPGGQVRYYGPTSNFNLVQMPAPDNLTVHRTVRNDGQEYLDCLGVGKAVPLELETHLTNLYFTWQDPAFHVVNREMFETAKITWTDNQEDTPYYSEALLNAICSLGAAFESRHHPTFVTFPKSLSDFFADRAKALLEIELDCPCVATVQAMVVLSSHDIGCKRDARGWLYSGMAMRLAFDLALHCDLTQYVAKKALTQAEADLRRDVFWGAYTIDHMWSFYLGRPFRINMEDVTVSKPCGDTRPESCGQWFPYVSPRSFEESTPLPDYTNELHRQRVLLGEIMAPLGYAFSLQELNVITVEALLNWQANLPLVLQVDLDDRETSYLPHVILLHMQYHQNIIHAHRPWMSRTYAQPSPPQGPGSSHARMMCIESAYAIAKLLQIYEGRYALRRMNIQGVGIACSAALLLIFANVTNFKRYTATDVGLHLSACFRALDEFGATWESSKRAKDFLVLLQRQWELRGRTARGRKPSPTDSQDYQLSRKRTRSSLDESRTLTQDQQDQSPPRPQPPSFLGHTGPVDINAGIDLDWIFTGDVYP